MFSQINESRDLGKVPVVVVGNKTDKVNENIYKSRMKSRRDSDERRDFWERDSHGGGHNGGHHGFGDHDGHENGYGGFGGGGHGGGGHYDHGFGHFGGGGSSGFGGGSHGGYHDYFGSKKKHKKEKRKRDYGLGESSLTSSHHDKYGHSKHGKRHTYEINWANTYTPDDFLDKDIADKVTNEWKVMYKECSAKDPEAVTDLFKSVMGVFEEVGVHRVDEDDRGCDYERPKACVIL